MEYSYYKMQYYKLKDHVVVQAGQASLLHRSLSSPLDRTKPFTCPPQTAEQC
jgi:hypothetical protein